MRDGDHRVLDARAERRGEGQRQHQARERQEDVGDAHQHLIHHAAEIARRARRWRGRRAPRSRATMTTMVSVMRAPNTTRAKMSRPSSSVPNRCCQLAGCKRSSQHLQGGGLPVDDQRGEDRHQHQQSHDGQPTIASGLRRKPSQARNQRPRRAWQRLAGAGLSSQALGDPGQGRRQVRWPSLIPRPRVDQR